MSSLKVFLVDDLDVMTEALSLWLGTHSDMSVPGTSRGAEPGLAAAVSRSQADVITLDVESEGVTARELIERVRFARPLAAVVVLTGSSDPALVVEAARAGADAWVHKQSPIDEVLDTIRAAAMGDCRYPPEHLGSVIRALREDAQAATAAVIPMQRSRPPRPRAGRCHVGGRAARLNRHLP